MKKTAVVVLLLSCIPSAYAGPTGEIRVCRTPRIQELMDGKRVLLRSTAEPGSANSWGSYTGACDSLGEHCRNIVVVAKHDVTLGPSKSSCAKVEAELAQSDSKPVTVGQRLVLQWSIPGFTPTITVTKAFR